MTVETALGMTAQTFTLVHPPGFSIRDSDNTPEVVAKNNPATAFATGDIVQVVANTIAGEAWAAKTGANNASKRYGHVTIASGGGAPTMTIIRHPRVVIPSYSGPLLSYIQAVSGATLFMETLIQNKAVIAGPAIEVTKPSGEFWSAGSVVYAYISGTDTLYTSDQATANAAQIGWVAGGIVGTSYGFGVTAAVIKVSLGMDTEFPNLSGQYPINDAVPLDIPSAVPLSLFSFAYVGPLRDQVLATSVAAASPILYGQIVGFDKTQTPTAYTYLPSQNMGTINHSVEYQQWRTQGHCFAQVTPVIFPDLSATDLTSAIPTFEWICLLGNFSSPTTRLQKDCLLTQRIITGAPPAIDLALDVDLPSPWTGLRIVWSCASQIGGNPTTFNLLPVVSRRTSAAAAPISGMQRAPGFRPPWANAQTFRTTSQTRTGPGISYGASESLSIDLFQSGHSNVPHVSWGYRPDAIPLGSSVTASRTRIGEVPTIRWYWDSSAGIEWAWGRYDYATSSLQLLTAWTAPTPAGGTLYYADVGLPPVADGEVHRAQVYMREGGATISPAASDNTASGTFTWWRSIYDGVGYGCYPYDISQLRLPDDADAAWVGHAGWCWPEPAITGPTWGATIAPSWTPATNTLIMPANPVASRVADAHVGTVAGLGNFQSLRANYALEASALVFTASAVTYSTWRDRGGSRSMRFLTLNTYRIAAPAPTPVSVDLEVIYGVSADSSYGRVHWVKNDRVPLAWP